MRKNTLLLVFLAFIGLLLSPNLYGQDCISGTVYGDLNNNGMMDGGETGLDGEEVIAIGPDGTVTSTFTEMTGYYEFCMPSDGIYFLYVNLGGASLVSNPSNYSTDFVGGSSITGLDFGIVDEADLGQVGGVAFYDVDGDGQPLITDPRIEGAAVSLSGAGVDLSTKTDADGLFSFPKVPAGDYLVSIDHVVPNADFPGGVSLPVGLGAGENINTLRFGMVTDLGFGTLFDIICYDLDADGLNDPATEPGIYNRAQVRLLNGAGEEVLLLEPDANGRYAALGLEPGDYQTEVVYDPLDFAPTTPTSYPINVANDQPVSPGPFYLEPLRRFFQCGMSLTAFAGLKAPNDAVLSVKDIRNRTGAPVGVQMDWNTVPTLDNPNWRRSKIGAIFGLTIDKDFDAYTGATVLYDGVPINDGSVLVYHISSWTGNPTPYILANTTGTVIGNTTMENTNDGIGNLAANKENDLLYITNFGDNSITVFPAFMNPAYPAGVEVLQVFDPTFNNTPGSDRPWGVAYNETENRVYYAREPGGTPSPLAEVWSAAVDPTTGFIIVNTEVQEFSLNANSISDLAFDFSDQKMLVSEREGVHSSAIYEYIGSHTSGWTQNQILFIGVGSGRNSGGGVDYCYTSFTSEPLPEDGCDTHVVGTGNALDLNGVPVHNVYGLAIIPGTGNVSGSFASLNSIMIDSDADIAAQDKGFLGDVEVFDCECAEADCASENGLELIPSLGEQGPLDCCLFFDYVNSGNQTVYGVQLTLLDGVEFFPGYTVDPGHFTPNFSNTSMTITPNGFGPMANGVNSILDFCLTNITAVPQYMVVQYLGEDYQPICTDTLAFECIPPAPCMEVLVDSLVCDTAGYKYTIDLQVPIDNDFPDGIGYIQFNLTQALPAGVTVTPTDFVFTTPLGPGDQVTLMVNINTSLDLFGDSLCFILTAHDDEEERLCCFLMEACIPFPDCPEPCDDVNATVIPAYQGDAAVCCDGPPLEYTWLQDLIGDCTALPCGAEVSCCTYQGQQVIVVEDDAELCSDPFGTVYDCAGGIIFQFGGIAAINLDLFEQLEGCQLIYDCYNPQANSECCFDLLLTDTFTSDPNLFTAVQTTIITPGVSFSGQSTLQALLNGWSINPVVPQQDLIWTHSSGITPNGVDDYLFTFCVEGTTSTDSIFVAVNWLSQDSVVCQDTVAVFCPDCLQIVNDSLSCVTDAAGNQSYLYEFSFINGSAFDVNAVSVSDIANPNDTILNAGVFQLPGFVPPGATYTGTIPVNIANGIDTACFEIVLRQIIGDSINISCCYVTHCVPLPPCDELPQVDCPDPNQVDQQLCLDVWEPVCGCDGLTYSNICYAENAGVVLYSPGPCSDQFDPTGTVSLGAQLEPGVGVQLNWMLADNPDDYDFFVLFGQWPFENRAKQFAIVPVDGSQQYSFLHLNAMEGNNIYQVVAINSQGNPVASNMAEVFIQNMSALQTTLFTYPVPARDLVYVTANRNGDATIELTGTDGKIHQLQQATFGGAPVPVETSKVSDGVFIIRVRFDDGETVHQRVVKLE